MEKNGRTIARLSLAATTILLLGLGLFYVACHHDPLTALKNYLSDGVSPALFLVLMAVLPIVGAPISIFLVLVGMKFGVAGGILLSSLTMFFHLVCTYYLVHSFLRSRIIRLIRYLKLPVPSSRNLPTNLHAFIFMIIPGLPYALKNNLLDLSGIPDVPYLVIGWTTQFGFSLPFIILGGAVIRLDRSFIILAAGLFALVVVIQQLFKKRLKKIEESLARAQGATGEVPLDEDS